MRPILIFCRFGITIKASLLILLMSFACLLLCSNKQLYAEPVVWEVLKPEFTERESYTQIYTLTTLFNDTANPIMIQMQFTLTNLGISDQNAGCKILVLQKNVKPVFWNKRYGKKKWSYTKNTGQQLKIGLNYILIKDGKTMALIENDKISAQITFDRTPDPIVPPMISLTSHNRFHESTVLIGCTKVQGVVKLPDGNSKKMVGYGVLELSKSTSFPSDICRGWVTFRGYNFETNSYFLTSLRVLRGKTSEAEGWIWKKSVETPSSISKIPFDFKIEKAVREKPLFPYIIPIDSSFLLEPQTLLTRYSIIDELGFFWGGIVKLVIGDPITYYYEAKVVLKENSDTIPGILEFMWIE